MLEDLNPIVAEIHNDYVPLRGHTDPRRAIHLTRPGSRSSELGQEVSVRLKYLDAMVTRVRHDDVPFLIDGDPLWSQELTVGRALCAEEASRLEVGVDD